MSMKNRKRKVDVRMLHPVRGIDGFQLEVTDKTPIGQVVKKVKDYFKSFFDNLKENSHEYLFFDRGVVPSPYESCRRSRVMISGRGVSENNEDDLVEDFFENKYDEVEVLPMMLGGCYSGIGRFKFDNQYLSFTHNPSSGLLVLIEEVLTQVVGIITSQKLYEYFVEFLKNTKAIEGQNVLDGQEATLLVYEVSRRFRNFFNPKHVTRKFLDNNPGALTRIMEVKVKFDKNKKSYETNLSYLSQSKSSSNELPTSQIPLQHGKLYYMPFFSRKGGVDLVCETTTDPVDHPRGSILGKRKRSHEEEEEEEERIGKKQKTGGIAEISKKTFVRCLFRNCVVVKSDCSLKQGERKFGEGLVSVALENDLFIEKRISKSNFFDCKFFDCKFI